MPRGIPASGRRAPRGSKSRGGVRIAAVAAEPEIVETDEEIAARLTERFDVLKDLAEAAVFGQARALIVSGPAGVGKSFTVDKIIAENLDESQFESMSGFVRATGLRRALWNGRHPGSVVKFDDSDSIFFDDVCLNLLKAACDSTKKRIITWAAESNMEDGDGDLIPRSFEFQGTVVFITNYDFDAMIEKGHRLSHHFLAMTSRAHYIDLSMKTKRDYVIRIKQVVEEQGMLIEEGFSVETQTAVLDFIAANDEKLRELSLRMALKLAMLHKSNPAKFQNMARITCCKR